MTTTIITRLFLHFTASLHIYVCAGLDIFKAIFSSIR